MPLRGICKVKVMQPKAASPKNARSTSLQNELSFWPRVWHEMSKSSACPNNARDWSYPRNVKGRCSCARQDIRISKHSVVAHKKTDAASRHLQGQGDEAQGCIT